MVGVIIILVVAIFIILVLRSGKDVVPEIPEIYRAHNIRDVVMAINHGRIYPFFTNMNLERVKGIVNKSGVDTTDFNNAIHLQELMGRVRGVHIPQSSNALLSDIYVSLNTSKIVSSITINISNLDFVALVEQMLLKFGNPVSINKQLMVWRDGCMTISLDSVNKYITVMDERLSLR